MCSRPSEMRSVRVNRPLVAAQDENGTACEASVLTDVLERRLLCVRPHRHRELLNLPEELEVGWMVSGHFWGFASCPNGTAFDALCADLRGKHGDFDINDMRSNDSLTGGCAAPVENPDGKR